MTAWRLGMSDKPKVLANDDMVVGYLDGLDLSSPEPTDNRSHSYRHGFANGRGDRVGKPRDSYAELVRMADLAMEKDRNIKAAASENAIRPAFL